MTQNNDLQNPDYIGFFLEAVDKSDLLELVERINAATANYDVEDNTEDKDENALSNDLPVERTLPKISVAAVLRVMVQDLLYAAEEMTRDDLLVKFNSEFAVDRGILTLREALREGVIPLTREHVEAQLVGLDELSDVQLEELGYSHADRSDRV